MESPKSNRPSAVATDSNGTGPDRTRVGARANVPPGVWQAFGMPPASKAVNNFLLSALPPASFEKLAKHLVTVPLELGKVIIESGSETKAVFFPSTDCLISIIATTPDDESAEVAIVGAEGLVGHSVLLGHQVHSHRYLVQIAGPAFKVSAQPFVEACYSDEHLMRIMLKYTDLLLAQTSQTALCNRLHGVEERLARWLLLSDDRVDKAYLSFTHEALALMLGTRRSTVSLTAATFQQAGYIDYQRGKILILDRKGLEAAACACYPRMVANLRSLLRRIS